MKAESIRAESARDEAALADGLVSISRRVRLLACATPVNLQEELGRAIAAWSEGRQVAPRFQFATAPDLSAERAALGSMSERGTAPFAARARELWVEASACEATGTAAFWGIARERFPRRDRFDDEADRIAEEWVAPDHEEDGAPAGGGAGRAAGGVDSDREIATDDPNEPRSLLCMVRRAAYEHRLSIRVVISQRLAALAATGADAIYVAAGRRATVTVSRRTALHEVVGHALPSARAKRSAVPMFRSGTAFGSDDQEGRALLIEQRAGLFGRGRRRELALRHIAARSVQARADFVETARALIDRGAPVEEALRISARVHRGGGLAREAAYIPAFLRVSAALEEAPQIESALENGRISVEAARWITGVGVGGARGKGGAS